MSSEQAELGTEGIAPTVSKNETEMKGSDENVVCVDAKEQQFQKIKKLHLAAFIFMEFRPSLMVQHNLMLI